MTWLRRLAERTIGAGESAAPAVRPYVPPRFAPDAPLGAAPLPGEIEIVAPAAATARGFDPGSALLVPPRPAPLAMSVPDPGRGGVQPVGQGPSADDRLDGRDPAPGARRLDRGVAIHEAAGAPTRLTAGAPDRGPAAGKPADDGAGQDIAPVASVGPAAAPWTDADPARAAARDRASADRAVVVDVDHAGDLGEATRVEPNTRARRDEAAADELAATARAAVDSAIARAGLAPRGRRERDAQLAAARQRHAGAGAEPAIHVTIGRVDVRAVLPGAAPRPAAPQPPRATLSLDEYLRQRNRGER